MKNEDTNSVPDIIFGEFGDESYQISKIGHRAASYNYTMEGRLIMDFNQGLFPCPWYAM